MEIGQDVETNGIVNIGDTPRQSGLYILGKPGMGKSNLIELSVLSDVAEDVFFINPHGVFFLDPHGDSTDKIVKYLKPLRHRIIHFPENLTRQPDGSYMGTPGHINKEDTPVRILNPEDEEYSFGINPLSCNDLTNLKERTDTYTRAYNVFYKIWEQEWGVWLQLIVQNTLYVFLENPEYTLADVPLFFTNENFRHHLVSNVKYNLDVKDFWLTRFANKREYDQQRQVDAALTRISILLGHPYVKHIIGQTKSKLDFSKIMAEGDIIFLKLSAALSQDIKKFIGMIVIGELLHHVRRRPTDKRDQFSVFIDEFQNFSTSDDLATFITEARKFGIATTIAHQERLGQLGDNKKMMGATLAAANKVYFQLTIKDAEELAGEFARDPPTETRLEEQYAISQNPISDLFKTHNNPYVRELVNKYLRPMKDRLSDIYGESEYERLERQGYLDDASMYRLNSQIEGVDYRRSDHGFMRDELAIAGFAIERAKHQTEKLKILNDEGMMIRRAMRLINSLLVDCMEEKFCYKYMFIFRDESFSKRLIEISKSASLPDEDRKVLELYIAIMHGGRERDIMVPFAFAKRQGLLINDVERIEKEINDEVEAQVAVFEKLACKVRDACIANKVRYWEATKFIPYGLGDGRTEWRPVDKDKEIKREKEHAHESYLDAIRDYRRGAPWTIPFPGNDWALRRSIHGQMIENAFDKVKPLKRRQPPDIDSGYIGISSNKYIEAAENDLKARGYGNIVDSINDLARLCRLLMKPENHIKARSGQYVEKQVYTRSEADMKAEMVKELANLPRYTAWVKKINDSNMTVKNKTGIYSVDERFEYNKDYMELLHKIIQNTHELYCTRRDLIEEEIIKRQARWRAGVENPPVQNEPPDKSDKPRPPSTRSRA